MTDAAVGLEMGEAGAIMARHEGILRRGTPVAKERILVEGDGVVVTAMEEAGVGVVVAVSGGEGGRAALKLLMRGGRKEWHVRDERRGAALGDVEAAVEVSEAGAVVGWWQVEVMRAGGTVLYFGE